MRREDRTVTVVGLLQVAALLTIVFSILTLIDIPNRYVELFTHFRLQYFVVSVVLLLAFVVLRSPWVTVALLFTAIINASLVVPWYRSSDNPAGSAQFKILHANVLSTNTQYQRLIDYILVEDPDIVFLQEVREEWVHGLMPLQSRFPHAYTEPRNGNFGIAMYSKHPLQSVRHVDSPPLGYPTIVATTEVNGKDVTLISSHPTIPTGKFLYESRNEQLQSIAELVRQANGEVVLIGDFNASLWDPRYRQLEKATGLKNARLGFGIQPSWPTFMPFAMIPIDHALVSEGISVLETRTGKRIGSDHLPLIVTVSM